MQKKYFRLPNTSVLVAAVLSSLIGFQTQTFAKEPPATLSPRDNLSVIINQKVQALELNAENQNNPLLNINLKRSLRLVNTPEEIKEFLAQGVNLEQIKAVFKTKGFSKIQSFSDLVIVKNFANGVKGFKLDEIFKRSMTEDLETHFWYAVFPRAAVVEKLFVQREWFSDGVGAHGQIRFQINSPLFLIPQSQMVENKEPLDYTKTDWKSRFLMSANKMHLVPGDFVYSLYALRYANGPTEWSFTTGMGGVFANAYTLSSTPHNVVYLAKDDFVEQHELKEARTLGTKVLFSSLLRADQYKENKIYHLIFNSCINELNRALYAGSQAYPLKDLGISSSDFNPYTFIEKLMPLFSETPVPSLNYEFGSPIKEKFINPEVLKLMPLVQSNEFDTALQSFALEASVLTYKDLNDIRLVLIELKKAQAANNISKIDLSSAEGLAVTLASSGYKLPEKSIKVLLTLLKNPDFMKAIQLLIQKGTVNLEKFVPALN